MFNHGINTVKSATDFGTLVTSNVGVPIYFGCAPVHTGGGYTGKPQIFYNYAAAVEALGFSEDWRTAGGDPKWNLCQAMYAQFRVFGRGPAVFYNLFDPATNKTAVAAADFDVSDHKVKLPQDGLIDAGLVVKNSSDTLTKGTQYEAYYDGEDMVIELLDPVSDSAYAATSLNIAYNKADLTGITATAIATAVEKIEGCKAMLGIVPDLLCAPGWTQTASVAAVLAAKAPNINGLYKAKAVVDLSTAASGGADTYDEVLTVKNNGGYTDENMIVCWGLAKIGNRLFDLSTLVCGLIGTIDAGNGGVPYETPSNKTLPISGLYTAAGGEILLTVGQADAVSVADGVVTALNYNGWRLWGNHTGCFPGTNDPAKSFICTSRVLDFLCNVFVERFWNFVDRPLTTALIDAIVNGFNAYLDGLTADGMLYGGRIEYVEDNNPAADLLAGRFRLDATVASPVPAERIDMYIEFDTELLTAAITG